MKKSWSGPSGPLGGRNAVWARPSLRQAQDKLGLRMSGLEWQRGLILRHSAMAMGVCITVNCESRVGGSRPLPIHCVLRDLGPPALGRKELIFEGHLWYFKRLLTLFGCHRTAPSVGPGSFLLLQCDTAGCCSSPDTPQVFHCAAPPRRRAGGPGIAPRVLSGATAPLCRWSRVFSPGLWSDGSPTPEAFG